MTPHVTLRVVVPRGRGVALAMAAAAVALALGLGGVPEFGAAQTESQPPPAATILAVVGRQVAWLNLEAPRHQPVSRLAAGANALEVTAEPDGSHVVVAAGAPFPTGGPRGADLLNLDPSTGDTSPLLQRTEARESLDSPTWWPDRSTLLFERQDLGGQPVGAPGQEVPRYPSRIDRAMADGSGRGVLLEEGRQPSAAPDGTRLVYARTRNQGAALLIWSQADWSVQTLIPEGRFADVAYPQFSPRSDQIAFVAPQSGMNGQLGAPQAALNGGPEEAQDWLKGRARQQDWLFGPSVADAHGIPWDAWIVNADGSGLRRVAETGADEPSVAWSPDQSQIFVYSGTGSFIADVTSGDLTRLSFVQGYGPVVWVASTT